MYRDKHSICEAVVFRPDNVPEIVYFTVLFIHRGYLVSALQFRYHVYLNALGSKRSLMVLRVSTQLLPD